MSSFFVLETQPKKLASRLPQISVQMRVCSPPSGRVRQFKVSCSLSGGHRHHRHCRLSFSIHQHYFHCKLRQMLGFATIQISLFEAGAQKRTQTLPLTESAAVNFTVLSLTPPTTTTTTSSTAWIKQSQFRFIFHFALKRFY